MDAAATPPVKKKRVRVRKRTRTGAVVTSSQPTAEFNHAVRPTDVLGERDPHMEYRSVARNLVRMRQYKGWAIVTDPKVLCPQRPGIDPMPIDSTQGTHDLVLMQRPKVEGDRVRKQQEDDLRKAELQVDASFRDQVRKAGEQSARAGGVRHGFGEDED